MLEMYPFYDMRLAVLAPMRATANAMQALFRSPYMPLSYTRIGRGLGAAAEIVERISKPYSKPSFNIDSVQMDADTKVEVVEDIVDRLPFCNLLRFRKVGVDGQPKILLAAPLSGHHATLLRGTVEALLPGHEVYITDWIDARMVPLKDGKFDLDDYIGYLFRFLRRLGPNVHVIAVCQPAVPVLAAVALMASKNDPCQPRTMTLMGGPIDTRRAPTSVTKLAEHNDIKWFEQNFVNTVPPYNPGGLRRVYPGFIQLFNFMAMNAERHMKAHVEFFNQLLVGDGESAAAHRRFYDEYLSVMDITAEFYLQTVKTVFQDHALPKGEMVWHDKHGKSFPVRPGDIQKTALLVVEGELDDISAVGQTEAAIDLCTGLHAKMKRYHLEPKVGHYGIFNGKKWRNDIMPVIASWIRTFDKPADKPANKPAPTKAAPHKPTKKSS
jgi:poly(3-hydroxybutyrate) depolymerase